jgi:hypothetical protein
MKKLRTNMEKWFDKLDERWRVLPLYKQHRYTLYFFAGYLLLTAGVILKVWHDAGKSNNGVLIEHIENPVLKKTAPAGSVQDTTSIILKK